MPCQHDWKIDEHTNIGICRKCEAERQFPWDGIGKPIVLKEGHLHPARESGPLSPGWASLKKEEKSRWYQAYAEEILADFKELGWKGTKKVWGIPAGTLAGIRARARAEERREEAVHPAQESGPLSSGWVSMTRPERTQWYKEHTDEILADYDELAFNKTLAIWGLPASTLDLMLKRNKLVRQRGRRHEARGLTAIGKKLEALATTLQDAIARIEALEARKVIETVGGETVIIIKPSGAREER